VGVIIDAVEALSINEEIVLSPTESGAELSPATVVVGVIIDAVEALSINEETSQQLHDIVITA